MTKRVLVVDDEKGVRDLLEDLLGRLGLEVHLAANGDEGVEKFEAVEPDMVVLDFLLPKRNGFGVAEAIRAHPSGANTPIVMMSGVFKNPKTAVEARDKYQVLDFISKPIDPDGLERLVAQALPQEERARSSERMAPSRIPPPSRERGAPSVERAAPAIERRAPRGGSIITPPPPSHRDGVSTIERPRASQSSLVDGVFQGRPVPELPEGGDLSEFPVAAVLAILRFERSTGMLDLTLDGTHRRVYVVEGRPTFMQSNAERENVGELLLRRGRINPRDLERCRRYMTERRRTLQQALLELRLVNEAELAIAYKLLAGQLLPLAVGMSGGSFAWRPTDAFVGRVPEGRYDPVQILFAGVARHVHPPMIFGYFAGREDKPLVRTAIWSQLEAGFRAAFPAAEAMLDAIDGSASFRRLSQAPGIDPAEAMPPLFAMVVSGMAVPLATPSSQVEEAVNAAVAVEPEELSAPLNELERRIDVFHDDIMRRTFFEVFEASPETSPEDLKSSYFALARKWHVDNFVGKGVDSRKRRLDAIFARITEAYETLSDPEKRGDYITYLDRKAKGLPTDVAEILRGEQLYDQALAMVRRRDYRGAREVLEEALRLNPDPNYHATLGWAIYQENPQDERAVAEGVGHLQRAVKEQKNLPIAYQHLGSIAFARKAYGEAKRWWDRCLAFAPDNIEASRGLRMIAQRSKSAEPRSGIFGRLRGRKN